VSELEPLPELLSDRRAYKERLERILPASITGTSASANEIAAAAAFVFVYIGAINRRRLLRPSMVIRMSDQVAMRRTPEERLAWFNAMQRSARAVDSLYEAWGLGRHAPWYQDNSREGIRDETFPAWENNGALIVDRTVPTTSSRGRYSLTTDFAALFDPAMTGDDLTIAITAWQQQHLDAIARVRAQRQRRRDRDAAGISVVLPGGGTRTLDAGPSSVILRGVIEEFTKTLSDPSVIFISQSGEKVNVVDEALLHQLRLLVNQRTLLPDCLIADLDPTRNELWFVEVVASDGPINEERKQLFTDWAVSHQITTSRCRFLTAFTSRTSREAKKALPVLARGTYAWFLDEPQGILSWEELTILREDT
jgi:BsuBI/PstI restriction endonuclease domain/BsuBI/PstI restriction endonuclease HTH domain